MTTSIQPVPRLAELRGQVLARSTKRMPKWKFRLAPDLVLQLQPKPTKVCTRLLSEVSIDAYRAAITKPGITKEEGIAVNAAHTYTVDLMFKGVIASAAEPGAWLFGPRKEFGDRWHSETEVTIYDVGDNWELSISRCWSRNAPMVIDMGERLAAAFTAGLFDHIDASLMLEPYCLVCGKRLSDPASMARFIGPECAGTSSVVVPRLQDVSSVAPVLI